MTVKDFFNQSIDIQCELILCYYNYKKDERIIASYDEVADKDIRYIYIEKNKLYIEVESDE